MGVSWRELVTALWRATTVDWRTSLHEEKGGRGIRRKNRRVVSSSYLVIPHMHTSIHTYMHIILLPLSSHILHSFLIPHKTHPSASTYSCGKSLGTRLIHLFPYLSASSPLISSRRMVRVLLSSWCSRVSLRMSHIKMTFDTERLAPGDECFLLRASVGVWVCMCVCVYVVGVRVCMCACVSCVCVHTCDVCVCVCMCACEWDT